MLVSLHRIYPDASLAPLSRRAGIKIHMLPEIMD